MNFKLTKAKAIVSVLGGILFALFSLPVLSLGLWYTVLRFLIGFVLGCGLVYVMWSLISKKSLRFS